MLAGFSAKSWAHLLEEDGRTYWQIEVKSPDDVLYVYFSGFDVVIDTETGEVKDVYESGNG
jgi:uncharacterized membrane protein YkoI